MSIANDKKERFHFLDGLRGIAASMIVIHHAFTAHIIKLVDHLKITLLTDFFRYFTQSGVDLFFVLSGVVLLRPYLRKQKEFKTGDYFYRRVKRIYPPYFFALLFGAFVVWFNNQYPTWYNLKGLRAQFSWTETLKEAFIINFDGTYYNLAWWSLQIEILFYILAPLIIFIFPPQDKINTRRIVVSICITLIVTYLMQVLFTNYFYRLYSYTYQVATFGKFVEYPLCFFLGVYLATKDFKLKQGVFLMLSGIVLIFSGLVLMRDSWVYLSVMHGGYGLFYAGVIILAFNLTSFKRFLSKPVMIWLGERSYSLFLIHFSVFYFIDNVVSHFITERNVYYGFLTRAIGIPLGLFAAMLLFYFVERKQARGLLTGNMFWPWKPQTRRGGASQENKISTQTHKEDKS